MRVWWPFSLLAAGLRNFLPRQGSAPGEQNDRPNPPSCFHSSTRRHVRALAAFILAIAALVAAPGVASAGQVMVSNLGRGKSGNIIVNLNGLAQSFTTGSTSGGYTLQSIAADFSRLPSSANWTLLMAAIHSASGSNPGNKVADLTRPSSRPSSTGAITFTAPANTQLAANTTYYLVLDCNTNSGIVHCGNVNWTSSTQEDTGAASGWSIANTRHRHSGSSWASSNGPFKIAVSRTAPDMHVQSNNVAVPDGDTVPKAANNTDIGEADVDIGRTGSLFSILNTGSEPLMLTGTPNKVSVGGRDAADFTVTMQPGPTVAPGGFPNVERVVVFFNPSVKGRRVATLTIPNNDPDENPYNFTIAGTGTDREIDVQGNNTSIPDGDTTPRTQDHTDFGQAGVTGGSVSRTFRVRNTGSDALTLTGTPRVTVSGTHASDFTVTQQPAATVGATSGSSAFIVNFNPSGVGVRTARLSIANNANKGKSPYDFTIQGTGTAVSNIEVVGKSNMVIADGDRTQSAADGTDFGSTGVTGMLTQTFTIRNTGGANLILTGSTPVTAVGAGAAHFTVTAQPALTVAPGGQTTFTIAFDPKVVGTHAARVEIAGNDPATLRSGHVFFLIRGTATATGALVSNLGRTHDSSNVTVNNAANRLQSFTTGSHPAGYVLESIEISAFQVANIGASTVRLFTGTPVATLTKPPQPANNQANYNLQFSAPADTILDPDTTYTLEISCSTGNCFRWRRSWSDLEDAGAAAGWSIGDGSPLTIRVNGRLSTETVTPPGGGGITVTPMALEVEEDGTGTFDVVLDTQPTADVTVSLSSSDTAVVTINDPTPPSQIKQLTFTNSDWNIPQTVTVTGVDDPGNNPGDQRMATIQMTVASADTDYFISTGRDVVTVTVTGKNDDDGPTGPTGPGPGGGGGGGSDGDGDDEETEEDMCSVSDVTGNDESLMGFVAECAAGEIIASQNFGDTLSLLEEFRDDEGRWNDGTIYLVLLSKAGGVYFHAEDRTKEGLDWSGIPCQDEEPAAVIDLGSGEGCVIDGGGYAHRFAAPHVPLTSGEEDFILLGGFSGTPDGGPFTGETEPEGPSTEAGDVDTDSELVEFVEAAGRLLMEAFGNPGIDPVWLRGILRNDEGPWREENVHVYIADETGRVIFDAGDEGRENEYVNRSLVENADEEVVQYTEGGSPVRGYVVEIASDDGNRVHFVGASYRVEAGGSGGGGCAVGGDAGGGAFGLFLAAFALLAAVLIKRRSSEKPLLSKSGSPQNCSRPQRRLHS